MSRAGTIRYPDGSRYSGEIIDGLPNGKGCFYDYRGDTYTGTFTDGDRHGPFLVKLRNGDCISCEYDCDAQYSDSVISYHSGDVYIGYIQELEPNGKGTMYQSDGRILRGSFRDGLLHGKDCEIISPDGTVHTGDYNNGEALG